MKSKKGFTLIELLAIIVILAIIAVITVPIILGIIEDASKGAASDSAYGFKDSVNKYYVSELVKDSNFKLEDGTYTVSEVNGNAVLTGEETYTISLSGTIPTGGSVIIENNDVVGGNIQIGNYCINLSDMTVTKGSCGDTPIPEEQPEDPSPEEQPEDPSPEEQPEDPSPEEQPEDSSPEEHSTIMPEIVTSGDGLYESATDEGRLIYRGANPNNYINIKEDGINNTLYRIVSFESDGTIKVVRNESIGDIAWDAGRYSDGINNTYCTGTFGCNVWGNQTNTLYNGSPLGDNFHYMYYESASATTLTNGGSGKVGSDSTLNQYLNSKTNNTTNSWQPALVLDNYIDNHSWSVGGVYDKDKGILKDKAEERQLKWTGKIALLNITEYAEASINSGCTGVESSKNSGYPCKESNWTFKGINEWSLSPYSGFRNNVWIVYSSGYFNNYGIANNTAGVRPAFYLKSGISLTGDGTSENPYSISNM